MKIKNLSLPPNTIVGYCEKCNGKLIIKEGNFGIFIGCSNFKDGCRNTKSFYSFEVDEFEYKILEVISNIRLNNFTKVKDFYESEDFNHLSLEMKNKIINYLFD